MIYLSMNQRSHDRSKSFDAVILNGVKDLA